RAEARSVLVLRRPTERRERPVCGDECRLQRVSGRSRGEHVPLHVDHAEPPRRRPRSVDRPGDGLTTDRRVARAATAGDPRDRRRERVPRCSFVDNPRAVRPRPSRRGLPTSRTPPTPREDAAPTINKTFDRRALAREAAENASAPKSIDDDAVPRGKRGTE